MGISVLTIQDEPDGSVTLNFTTDPVIETETQGLTSAQTIGFMVFHDLKQALEADLETDNDSAPESNV